MSVSVRSAVAEDVPLLCALISEMSEFERLPSSTTEERLLADGFGQTRLFSALLAFVDGEPAGYALMHGCYSDFEGRGLFLESFYVKERFRGHKVSERLFNEVRRIARDQRCHGIALNILRWNSRAQAFFRRVGAVELDDRSIFLVTIQ